MRIILIYRYNFYIIFYIQVLKIFIIMCCCRGSPTLPSNLFTLPPGITYIRKPKYSDLHSIYTLLRAALSRLNREFKIRGNVNLTFYRNTKMLSIIAPVIGIAVLVVYVYKLVKYFVINWNKGKKDQVKQELKITFSLLSIISIFYFALKYVIKLIIYIF